MHIRRFGPKLAFYFGRYQFMLGLWVIGLWRNEKTDYGWLSTQLFALSKER